MSDEQMTKNTSYNLLAEIKEDRYDSITIKYKGKSVVSISLPKNGFDHDLSIDDITVEVTKGEKTGCLSPVCVPSYAVDENLIERIGEVSQGAKAYCKANYQRISSNVNFFKRNIDTNKSILDLGGNPPLFALLLSKMGYTNISVVDVNADEINDICRKYGISAYSKDISTDSMSDIGQYDVICLNEVIEHLSGNLIDSCSRINTLVHEGGYIYLTTPNLSSLNGIYGLLRSGSGLASKLNEGVFDQYKRYYKNGYYGHIREYTPKEIVCFFENFGFQLVDSMHTSSRIITDGIDCDPELRAVNYLESFFPHRRLFASYLFKKIQKISQVGLIEKIRTEAAFERLLEVGDVEKAMTTIAPLLGKKLSSDEDTALACGKLLMRYKHFEEAYSVFSHISEDSSFAEQAFHYSCHCLIQLGEDHRVLQKVQSTMGNNPEWIASFPIRYGELFRRFGKYAESIIVLSKVTPNSVEYRKARFLSAGSRALMGLQSRDRCAVQV